MTEFLFNLLSINKAISILGEHRREIHVSGFFIPGNVRLSEAIHEIPQTDPLPDPGCSFSEQS
jgi:hypothetical protein